MIKENKKDKIEVSPETQGKIIRLFTYLEKALSLDDTITRDFKLSAVSPSPWWLADYPVGLDNLFIKNFETEIDDKDSKSSSLVKVQKKTIEQPPKLPDVLIEWIIDVNPMDEPIPLEKIDRKVFFNEDKDRVEIFKNFRKNFEINNVIPEKLIDWVTLKKDKLPELIDYRYIPSYWIEYPELNKLLVGYINNDWKKWSEKVNKAYKANLLYDQLYALRLLLKNEGDAYELLLGHGVLTWDNKSVGKIYSPIFFTPLSLDFDATNRTIELSPDPMFKSFVEISPVSDMDNPAEVDLDKWMGLINAEPFDFWHFETLKTQVNTFLNYLSPDSDVNFSKEIISNPEITKNPSICNAPVILVRKRTNSLWSKYAETIKRDIENNGTKSTEFINDLIGEYDKCIDKDESDISHNEESSNIINESELLFPLPWNDEQKRIAERIESYYGVVVKGPPGTGKSHTIANLIARFLAQGKSVLVTSQTSKALEVLRDKLPKNIRSLVVSQLGQTAKRDGILQQSIAEISSNLGDRDTKFSESKVKLIRSELHKIREEKSSVANLIRKYVLADSTQKLKIFNEEISPIEAAKLIHKYCNDDCVGWFTDKVEFDQELKFTEKDLKDAYALLYELPKNERDLYKFDLPDQSILPNSDVVSGAFYLFDDFSHKSESSNKLFKESENILKQDYVLTLFDILQNAHKILITINNDYEKEIFNVCGISQNERDKWSTILQKISEKIKKIRNLGKIIFGHEVYIPLNVPFNDLEDGAIAIRDKVVKGSKISTFGKMLLPSKAKLVLEKCLVNSRCPDNSERISLLINKLELIAAEKDVMTLIDQAFLSIKNRPTFITEKFDIVQIEVFLDSIARLVNYYSDFLCINDYFKEVKELSNLKFTETEDICDAIKLISSSVAHFELLKLKDVFNEWIGTITSYSDNPHKISQDLVIAIKNKSINDWDNAVNSLSSLNTNKKKSERLNEIVNRIKIQAPNLYEDIVGLANKNIKFSCPENLELAWKIERCKSWLDYIHDHLSIDELQNQHERLSKKEFQLNSDLVTLLAWQKQIDKVTKPQRDALMAWSDSMKKYGKGTGKWAYKHLSAAQESLKEAKNAVPVWIMPLHRVAQMFSDPKAGMFDIVIFDEASQCDIRGLEIGYLGKKLLVVGDPDQISPAGIFQDQERIYELISRFLYDIPHKDNFSITASLFDLAKIRIPNLIQLNEHFRCVPEVIEFSNHHIYEGKLKPLRYPNPSGLLRPALVPKLVNGGYQNTNNKVNEPEARAIVDKIAELLDDPLYQQRPDGHLCTFGVISLLAEDQAKYIKELLLRHPKVGEKVIEERNIVCGDAYAFQGDERDVIFLSMVKALDPNNPNDTVRAITDKGTAQRFNVAATRGRDQVFLYHSIPVEEFRNQDDWRYKILNWYYNPKTEELEAGRKILKKEFDSGRASQFSYDVGNLIIDKGYQVLPEYPVIGYRIDLVIQGDNARLAVECDGDQYHTLENWEEDQFRERQLRRAGWEFWRISGSSFYRNKENALDSLWVKLEELGIKPILEKK